MERNDLIRTEITGWSSDGAGVARPAGLAVFVSGGVPGDVCDIRVTKVAKTHAFARVENLVEPSALRVENDCEAFPKCGGCALRHVSYAAELEMKYSRVSDCLRRIGGLEITPEPILPAPKTESYRNKAVYQLGFTNSGEREKPAAGFYSRASHDIVAPARCLIQSERANTAATVFLEAAEKFGVEIYDERDRSGDVRHLFYREAADGSAQLVVCAKTKKIAEAAEFIAERLPWIPGLMLCQSDEDTGAQLAGKISVLFGADRLRDRLCGLDFDISPRSFYQVNREQAERLYALAIDFAELDGTETALDLYCGIGTITLCIARHARRVVGAEIVPEAIADAKENAALNHIENAEFFCGDAADIASGTDEKFDVVFCDPPRKGLSPEAVAAVAALKPQKIVYVSCDPATFARDLKIFAAEGYKTLRVRPVDMFPRTSAVEAVALMVRG